MIKLQVLFIALLLPVLSVAEPTLTVIPGNRPKRPALPFVLVHQQPCPIVAFTGVKPVALIDGRREAQIRPKIVLRPGTAFGPGLVAIDLGQPVTNPDARLLGPEVGKAAALNATLTPDRDLADAFAMVVVYETMEGVSTADTAIAIGGMELGRLAAGQKKAVRVEFPDLDSSMTKRYTLLVYDAGTPIATSLGNEPIDLLLEINDRLAHAKAMDDRMHGNQKLKLFRSFSFKFDDALKQKYAGRALQARVQVSAEGFFVKVDMGDVTDPALTETLTKQLGQWLFLPPVVDGKEQPVTVVLPLKF